MLEQQATSIKSRDSLRIEAVDYIELYVGNVHQAAHYYRTAFGFTPMAYSGLETGECDKVSMVMEQSDIRLVLTSALNPNNAVAEHVKLHADSVKDIAFRVENVVEAFQAATRRGAKPVMEPTVFEDSDGQLGKATVAAFGDTVHSFVERTDYKGRFLPNYRHVPNAPPAAFVGLDSLDHLAISTDAGRLNDLVGFYEEVLGFHQSHQEDVSTDYSAMNSKVVETDNGMVKFPIMEPAVSKRKSQIEEYLNFHHGPGVQHIAFRAESIIQTVRHLRGNSIEFLKTPSTYYEMLEDRVGKIEEEIKALSELNILADRDPWGYLLQIFTKPVQSRPTLFMEVIQRSGARGFGSGNIKALFEAIEREQANRGTL
jgi:4-hydroxyphenylpyruvate dioxygenase